MSTPASVCEVVVVGVGAVEEGVFLIAMAGAPRTVGGKMIHTTPGFGNSSLDDS